MESRGGVGSWCTSKLDLVRGAIRATVPPDRADVVHEADEYGEEITIVPRNERSAKVSVYWSGTSLGDDDTFCIHVEDFDRIEVWFAREEDASSYFEQVLRSIRAGSLQVWSARTRTPLAAHVTEIPGIGRCYSSVFLPLFLYRLLGVRRYTFEPY